MKRLSALWTPLWVLGALASAPAALADTEQASCEVRKDGDVKEGRSGPCTFSQRQGNVGISLRNGDRWDLVPTGQPNQFRDQRGNQVTRSVQGRDHVYRWPNKKIVVRFGAGYGSAGASSSSGQTPSDLRNMVHGRWVGGEVADEMQRRGYRSVRDEVAGRNVTSFYKGHGKCAVVTLDADRRVKSIVTAPESDCRR